MQRRAHSHKGENGIVAVIGGSSFMHGAPLFSALAAEAAGVDLVFVSLPAPHASVARHQSLNFQVHPFGGDELRSSDVKPLVELLATVDSVVIGPGIARDKTTLAALKELIESVPCAMVLDASALQPWSLASVDGKNAVLTPHLGELERMGIRLEDVGQYAAKHNQVLHVKGPIDHIAMTDGLVKEVIGGNAGLTVGGTGDALAGVIAALLAQKYSREDACTMASKIIKQAGDDLMATQGHAYTTRQVIHQIPGILKDLV